jgi:hypothetical protein
MRCGAPQDIELVPFSSTMGTEEEGEDGAKARVLPVAAGAVVAGLALAFTALLVAALKPVPAPVPQLRAPAPGTEGALFDRLGRYVLRDYDKKKPMSNFLSGLAGPWGVPMWTFYVNRGQVTSFNPASPCDLSFCLTPSPFFVAVPFQRPSRRSACKTRTG